MMQTLYDLVDRETEARPHRTGGGWRTIKSFFLTSCCFWLSFDFLPFAALTATAQEASVPSSKAVVAALQPFVDSHSLAGAVVLVADKDNVLCLDAVGFADVAAKKPLKSDALFWIASQSKPITATALMMLVDEGKVKLDDPVENYLPEFKGQELEVDKVRIKPKQPITVRQILSHTSGMPFKSALEQPTLDLFPLSERVKSYAKTPLQFEPGSKYQYSNAGINTAGRIIEVVSGMAYEDFLQKRLFEPLGMKDTTFQPNQRQIARLAKAYRPSNDKMNLDETPIEQLTYPLNDPKRRPMPAGGLFSTAADIGRFCQMILNDGEFKAKRYLSKGAVEQMTSKQTAGHITVKYGLGWSTGDTFGHGGAYSTNMTIDPKRGLIFVWMVQHAGFPANGGKSQDAFRKAAEKEFAQSKK
jgi:CubicO group peptidase (beta-lactamase class C family)